MSAPDTRLVPAGRELRDQLADLLRYLHPDSREPIKSFVAAWDAAPADPAAIVRSVALSFYVEDADEDATPAQREIADMLADVLLSALGCVPARETNEKPGG